MKIKLHNSVPVVSRGEESSLISRLGNTILDIDFGPTGIIVYYGNRFSVLLGKHEITMINPGVAITEISLERSE